MVESAPTPPQKPQMFVSRCRTCGQTELFTADDLLRYRREGWPVCCGQRMRCYFAGQEEVDLSHPDQLLPDETSSS